MERTNLTSLVEAELNRRHWRLHLNPNVCASLAEFVGKVATRLHSDAGQQAGKDESERIRAAITHQYCFLMHAALQHPSSRTQKRVMEEFHEYGWPIALSRCGYVDLAGNALNEALAKLWERRGEIQNPGAVLSYFATILRNQIYHILREVKEQKEHEIPEVDQSQDEEQADSQDSEENLNAALYRRLSTDEFAMLERFQSRSALFNLLERCLKDWKKAFTLIADFFLDLSPQVIAWILSSTSADRQIRVRNVTDYKFHAMNRLRNGQCPDVVAALTAQIQG